jgi:hypothetical protein
MKQRLLISFSGGRTSAYMMWWLLNVWEDRHNWEIIVVFANTGKEVEATLFFVDECAQEWGIDIVWVEGYPSKKGKGWAVEHKVVTYETASRKGEPFEAMIARLGIPSNEAPFCSPQLKRLPIESYAKSIGWVNYHIAIGIRQDEAHRVNPNWISKRIFYPLCGVNPITKRRIKEWWDKQSFDLNIHPDDGNCDACWKKAFDRLARIMVRKPQVFDWWEDMQNKYGQFNPRNVDYNANFNFFRGNSSVADIRQLAEMSQAELKQMSMFDVQDGCGESCEVF